MGQFGKDSLHGRGVNVGTAAASIAAEHGGVGGPSVGGPKGPTGSIIKPTPTQPQRTSMEVPTRLGLSKNEETGKMEVRLMLDKSAANLQNSRFSGRGGVNYDRNTEASMASAQQSAVDSANANGRAGRAVVTIGREEGSGTAMSFGGNADRGLTGSGIAASTGSSAVPDATIASNQEVSEDRQVGRVPKVGPATAAFKKGAAAQVASGFAKGNKPDEDEY